MFYSNKKKAVSSGYMPRKVHYMSDADRRSVQLGIEKMERDMAFHAELMADAERDER